MRRLLSCLIGVLCFTTIAFAENAPVAPAPSPFTLNTNAFLDKGALPVLYTCDGKDVSPAFDWTNVPAKTQSLALIVVDPEAPGGQFFHWIVYNIPTTVTSFAEGMEKVPTGVVVGKNNFDKMQYNGPCPPKGSAHTYSFVLYALDAKLSLPAGSDGKTVDAAIQKHIIGKVELTAVYSRWLK